MTTGKPGSIPVGAQIFVNLRVQTCPGGHAVSCPMCGARCLPVTEPHLITASIVEGTIARIESIEMNIQSLRGVGRLEKLHNAELYNMTLHEITVIRIIN